MRGIGQGMVTTFKHFLKPAITEQYPQFRRELPERSRMGFALNFAEDGSPLCKACGLCERSCPDDAIKIESEKRTDGPGRVLKSFQMDLGRCMYCGLCVEQCASDGLRHTGEFEHSVVTREETLITLYQAGPSELLVPPAMDEVTTEQVEEVADTFGHAPVDASDTAAEGASS